MNGLGCLDKEVPVIIEFLQDIYVETGSLNVWKTSSYVVGRRGTYFQKNDLHCIDVSNTMSTL